MVPGCSGANNQGGTWGSAPGCENWRRLLHLLFAIYSDAFEPESQGFVTAKHLAYDARQEIFMNWIQRWRQRRIDLAAGADSDLIQENQTRFRRSAVLIAVAFLFSLIDWKLAPARPWHVALASLAILCFAVGFILSQVARAYRRFLKAPDPEEPPSIFKE